MWTCIFSRMFRCNLLFFSTTAIYYQTTVDYNIPFYFLSTIKERDKTSELKDKHAIAKGPPLTKKIQTFLDSPTSYRKDSCFLLCVLTSAPISISVSGYLSLHSLFGAFFVLVLGSSMLSGSESFSIKISFTVLAFLHLSHYSGL